MTTQGPLRLWSLTILSLIVAACGGQPQGAPSGPKTSTHVTLWLDYTPWGAHVPIFTALSKGYFRREGLDVSVRVPANVTDPLKLVAAGGDTLGIGYMSDVVTAEAQGIPVESVAALVQHHLNCIMTLKSSGITSPRQLAGKRIGAAETPADSVILDTVFKHAGVYGKVQRVDVNYDYVPALLSHRVDAIEGGYQVWERIEIEQRGQQVNVIQLQDWGVPDEYELVLLASRAMVKSRAGTLAAFMKGLDLGVAFAMSHPSAAVGIFLHDNPAFDTAQERALVTRSWQLLRSFVRPSGVRFGSQSPKRWRDLARWMYENRLVNRIIPTSELFTSRFQP